VTDNPAGHPPHPPGTYSAATEATTDAEPVRLTAEQAAAIARHGEATFPDECCGALLGRVVDGERVVERLLQIDNQWAATERRRRFLITPQQYLQLERAADRAGETLIGFYHSHPNAPARPSEFDREHALPWHSYLIASVVDGRHEVTTAWQLNDDRSSFVEVEVRGTGCGARDGPAPHMTASDRHETHDDQQPAARG
jgi:proteasome lid subunit RPN8/RPN11